MRPQSFAAVLVFTLLSFPLLSLALGSSISSQALTLDGFKGAVAKYLSNYGISTNPMQVWVGEGGYLFLGSMYADTLANSSLAANPEDYRRSEKRREALEKVFNSIQEDTGIHPYLVIGPNKSSIKKDFLPAVFQSGRISKVELQSKILSLSANVVNPVNELLKARKDTYYKTDTHWNQYGAYIGYKALMSALQKANPLKPIVSLNLEESDFIITHRSGGDLASFLFSQERFVDFEVMPKQKLEGRLVQVGAENSAAETWNIMPTIYQPPGWAPTVYENEESLNPHTVLWARDSFGTAMTPYMFKSFRKVVSIHLGDITNLASFKTLIEDHNVDAVVFTIVERSLMSDRPLNLSD